MVTVEEARDLPFDNEDEFLYRQVHPHFLKEGRIQSSVFKPNSDDEKKLSIDRDSLATSADSTIEIFEARDRKSAGIAALKVKDANDINDLYIEPDPLETAIDEDGNSQPENLAHSLLNMSSFSNNQIKNKVAKELQIRAKSYGKNGIDLYLKK